MLVNDGHSTQDVTVHRNSLTGMDHNDIAFLKRLRKDLHFDAVTVQPGVARLLAECIEQQFLRALASFFHEAAAEAQAPAADGTREDRQRSEAPCHDNRIQGIHPDPFLLQEHPTRLFERGDR